MAKWQKREKTGWIWFTRGSTWKVGAGQKWSVAAPQQLTQGQPNTVTGDILPMANFKEVPFVWKEK